LIQFFLVPFIASSLRSCCRRDLDRGVLPLRPHAWPWLSAVA
jgi:hypothetical protein